MTALFLLLGWFSLLSFIAGMSWGRYAESRRQEKLRVSPLAAKVAANAPRRDSGGTR